MKRGNVNITLNDDYGGSDNLFHDYEDHIELETAPTRDITEIIEDAADYEKKERLEQ